MVGTVAMIPRHDLLPDQRAALVMYWLCHGESLRTRQVATMFCVSYATAYRLLCHISQVTPIYNAQGVWQVCAMKEQESQ